MVRLVDGTKVRINGTPGRNTKLAAEQAEHAHIDRVLNPPAPKVEKKEVPTLKTWFYGDADPADAEATPNGRFWLEHVVPYNKPSEQEAKISIYRHHLRNTAGSMALDQIGAGEVATLRSRLMSKQPKLSRKRVNNVLCVLSKALRYAVDVEVMERAPKIGLLKCERPEIEAWSFDEYARMVAQAAEAGPVWHVAVCLAGEAGLRAGEVKGLRWSDVDLVGRTLTIQRQIRRGIEGTPKGGRRRVVPLTSKLERALRALDVVRTGSVVRNLDGSPIRDGQATNALRRICHGAGLQAKQWHSLRHTYGTHLALLGVNPFRLQAWMGHARMEETLLYVHFAQAHPRPLPAQMIDAGVGESDPDLRALSMLSARAGTTSAVAKQPWALRSPRRGKGVTKTAAATG